MIKRANPDTIGPGRFRKRPELNNLQPVDMAPLGAYHVRGWKATIELARNAGLGADMHVLDVGSGVDPPGTSPMKSDAG